MATLPKLSEFEVGENAVIHTPTGFKFVPGPDPSHEGSIEPGRSGEVLEDGRSYNSTYLWYKTRELWLSHTRKISSGVSASLDRDLFISYAHKDQTFAKGLADLLDSEGFDIWWDRELHVGQAFPQIIEQVISRARYVIVLWSKNSCLSEWVRRVPPTPRSAFSATMVLCGSASISRLASGPFYKAIEL